MKTFPLILVGLATVAVAAPLLNQNKTTVGAPMPNGTRGDYTWSLTDSNGKSHSVDDYKGKFLVLEWTNKDCPYVRRHYETGNMQQTQAKARAMGAVWLSVISAGEGQQGYLTPSEANAYRAEMKVKSDATVFDPQGSVGHLYGAKATPQIVVINPKGTVIYNGAIDDKATPDESDSPSSHKNYALTALKEAMAGQPVSTPTSRPYGCGIHYAH